MTQNLHLCFQVLIEKSEKAVNNNQLYTELYKTALQWIAQTQEALDTCQEAPKDKAKLHSLVEKVNVRYAVAVCMFVSCYNY